MTRGPRDALQRDMKSASLLLSLAIVACSTESPPPTSPTLRSATMGPAQPRLEELSVDIRNYLMLAPDSLPHDPAVGNDGALWVTEQKVDRIARVDPLASTIRDYSVRPGSGPHGLAIDKDGYVWFTAKSGGYIGKLDPKTAAIDEYRMPDTRAKDPHSLAIAPNGVVWFTVEESNFVGRLDPKKNRIDLVELVTANAHPYGITIGQDGSPYVAEFGTNAIVRIDPRQRSVQMFALPDGARPRRLAFGNDGMLYYTDFARGRLGRLDPTTSHVDDWASPGGAKSEPFALTTTPDGDVWYSETSAPTNTLVRFDPHASRFAEMPLPTPNCVARNMAATKDGKLYIACSGANLVSVAKPRYPVSSL
jgi:virginiamycin B lyase